MNVTIITIGFTGDIYPCISLGLELQKAGHQALIATHADFEAVIRRHRVAFFPIKGAIRDILQAEQADVWWNSNHNPVLYGHGLVRMIEPVMHQAMIGFWKAAQNADLLVLFGLGVLPGLQIAEKLQVPFVLAYPVPIHPTRAFPCFLSPSTPRLMGIFNQFSYTAILEYAWHIFRPMINRVRQETLGLSRLSFSSPFRKLIAQRIPTLYVFSPALVPKPADWGEWLHVTGYWFLDPEPTWQPPAGLVDFLASGPPPVYVGFGSMIDHDSEEMTDLVVKALLRSGRRGILATGWGGLINIGSVSDDIFTIHDVPHEWLFPQVAAVVHHGGLGTVSNAIRAGVPSIVVPFLADQFFWGQQVFKSGAGTRPIPRRHVTADRLAAAIVEATYHPHDRLRVLSRQMRAEHGPSNALRVLDQVGVRAPCF